NKKIIVADVVGYAVDPLLRTFIVNRGEEEGVTEGVSVVSEHGFLLGRVVRVFKRRSFVEKIQSPNVEFLVHFEGKNTRSDFVAKGMVNYVLGTKIQKGNYEEQIPVVTSGLDGKFPPGLLVGEADTFVLSRDQTFIESVIKTDNETKQRVFIIAEGTYQ
ncbi:MAG: hypothetical protein HZA36_03225, partial [Parcubacteria group bacterium]|nr:hypothetical protein [Parcubacteria group bacterium]